VFGAADRRARIGELRKLATTAAATLSG